MDFLNEIHSFRYKLAMSLKVSSFTLGEFTYVSTSDPNKDFVIGEEDGKNFVLPINKDCVKFESDVKKCLGFDYYYKEQYPWKEGIKIGIVDRVVEILKTFNEEKEIKNYLINQEIAQYEGKDYAMLEGDLYFTNPYEEFLERLKDNDLEKVKMLGRVYQEVKNFLDMQVENSKAEDVYKEIESELIKIARKYGVEVDYGNSTRLYPDERISEDEEHVEEEIKEPINVNSLLAKIRAKKVMEKKDEFLNFLLSKEGEFNVWGEVRGRGIILDEMKDKNATLLITSPQELEINIGLSRRIFVPKPSILFIKRDSAYFEIAR
ncbi:hypothetical protein [Acidianus sp. HS-5]|uniref:hypothetical protein n=1 Tax=Acidianus sp. HS-5 TaxID=2886040 RepID=UPI001F1AAB3C|nr:hypothetical protein [Acidianus sp. HS-5]BDC17881.1 hypothetical protein HS5_07710 [Acidianus sp. HS-5]